jgi:signal peptidase II
VQFRRHESESSTRPEGSVSAEPARTGPEASRRYLPIALAVAAAWLLLDQVTKWWAEGALDDGPIDVVWTLRFRLVTNSGASFSLGEGFGPVIGVVALVVVGVLLWTGRSIQSRFAAVGLGLVLGGALGNVLDRAFRSGDGFMGGSVIDWIDVQWWPVWNVADMGVVVGAIMLMIASLRTGEDDDDGPAEVEDVLENAESSRDALPASAERPSIDRP